MAIKQKIVCICDICGYMVDAVKIENGTDHGTPDTWSHGKSGCVDICPKCTNKLERPEWSTRDSREKGFRYADARKK